MGYFLFIDESGQDRRESPYEVLAGVITEDRDIWPFICQLHALEIIHFGTRISNEVLELKAKKLLKRKVFKHAGQMVLHDGSAVELVKSCLEKGKSKASPTREELTALGQAKIEFVKDLLTLCAQSRIKIIASIILPNTQLPLQRQILRKDYAYLFERFYYFLEEKSYPVMGSIVFDELDKSKSHMIVEQMESYFLKSRRGKERASLIIPEPFFVHSDLTTLIQIADIAAYIISWGVRFGEMTLPARDELKDLAMQVCALRFDTRRDFEHQEKFFVWGFSLIKDLKPLEYQC